MKPDKVLCCMFPPPVLALTVHKTQLLNCTSTIIITQALRRTQTSPYSLKFNLISYMFRKGH